MIIYNLCSYLRTAIPSMRFFANGVPVSSPDDCIYVNENQGSEAPWYDRQDFRVQFISKSRSRDTSKQNADTVYRNIKKKYGVILPAITVGGVVYPQVQTWAIKPIETPQYIADDENGCPLFGFSVTITTTIK